MSGDPLLRFIRDDQHCLEVIETKRGSVSPFLTIPRRSVVAGLLLVAILFPPLFEIKLALSREEESQCTFQEET